MEVEGSGGYEDGKIGGWGGVGQNKSSRELLKGWDRRLDWMKQELTR
jgi:hypothetical protein